ncbi:hypothetical protein HNV08_10760 [Winogradskyella eckloniae]|uniref:hypothetical protein n=1 Tax=Winogradskyella eckloniae TaxID=1089306 RepID=UPI001565975C|nr:hypothetical protein [Winogradskyella eckloniae]NRD20528.1 hypothetical protein [Winogradskyella eckloniae]
MAFSLSKIFGNSSSQSKTKDSVEAIIREVENQPYGVAEHNVLFAGLNELGGYYFFQTVIVGQLNVKCKTGAKLTFSGDNFELQLDSDMPEFESDRSRLKGRNITKIDFQVEESDVKKLENASLNSVQIAVKKHNLLFKKVEVVDTTDEEE